MDISEELREEAAVQGAEVIDWNFESDRIKGLYCDGFIAVSRNLDTTAEKAAVIAEELGHHLTVSGNIVDQSDASNRKQELKGRAWAYNRLVGLPGIIKAYKSGCQNRYEIAEALGISETMLQDAIDYYHEKHGLYVRENDYIIFFEPLGVMELIQ